MKALGALQTLMGNLTRTPIIRSTAWLFLGFATRMSFQAGAYVVLARLLGPEEFGIFAAALALANVLAPLVEYGAFNLVVRDIVAGTPTRHAVGIGVGFLLLTLPLGIGVLLLLKLWLLPHVDTGVVLGVGMAIFVGNRAIQLSNGANLANNTPWRSAILEGASGLTLLLASLLSYLAGADILVWVYVFVVQSFAIGGTALVWVSRVWGTPRWNWSDVRTRFLTGFHFAVNGVATAAYADLDKALLARLSTLEEVGTYTAAHRFAVLGTVPLAAFLNAIYPRFFATGSKGLPEARQFAWKVLPVTLGYGVIASAGLWLVAPLLGLLLGEGYTESVEAMRWLCWAVVLQGLQMPFAEALTGSGLQAQRTVLQVFSLLMSVCLNLVLIPSHGWHGAAMAVLASQAVLTMLLIYRCHR